VLDGLGEQATDEDIDEMIRMCDFNGDGELSFPEFYRMASGQSLAPIGQALPPPKDVNEIKQLNRALEQKQAAVDKQLDRQKTLARSHAAMSGSMA